VTRRTVRRGAQYSTRIVDYGEPGSWRATPLMRSQKIIGTSPRQSGIMNRETGRRYSGITRTPARRAVAFAVLTARLQVFLGPGPSFEITQ
jgi:hypothetical protein